MLISKFSYQIFLLDPFVEVMLFTIFAKVTTITVVLVVFIAGLNVLISSLICILVSKTKYLKYYLDYESAWV